MNNNNSNIIIEEKRKKEKKCPVVVRKDFVALANSVRKSLRDNTLAISDLFRSNDGTKYYQVKIEEKPYYITKEEVMTQLPTTAARNPEQDNFNGNLVKNGCQYTYKGQDSTSYKFTLIPQSKLKGLQKIESSIKHTAQDKGSPLQCPKQIYFTKDEALKIYNGGEVTVDGPKTAYRVKANGMESLGKGVRQDSYAISGLYEIFADLDDNQNADFHTQKNHLTALENKSQIFGVADHYYYSNKFPENTCFYRVTFPSLLGGAVGTQDFSTYHFGLRVLETKPVDRKAADWRRIVKQFRELVGKSGAANQWSGAGTEVGWLSHFSNCQWGEGNRGWQLNKFGQSIQENLYSEEAEIYQNGKEDFLPGLYEALFTTKNPKCVALTTSLAHAIGQGNYGPGVFSEEDQRLLSMLQQAMDNFVKNSNNSELQKTYHTKKKVNPESFDAFEPTSTNLIMHGLIDENFDLSHKASWQDIKNLQLRINDSGFGLSNGIAYLLPMHDTRTKQFDELTWFLNLKDPNVLKDPLLVGKAIKLLHFFARGLGDYHPKIHGTSGWLKGFGENEEETQLILQNVKDLQNQTLQLKNALIPYLKFKPEDEQLRSHLNQMKQASINQLDHILQHKQEIWILSCDGGGIRGAIGAHFLHTLQAQMGERKIVDAFDFFAGTSTGSLIALTFVMPEIGQWNQPKYNTENLVDLYTKKGGDIFSGKSKASALLGSQYSHLSLESLLRNFYGTVTMSQLLKPTLVTSVGLTRGRPVFFTSYEAADPHKKNKPDAYAWEIARTSSAAPAFFSPMVVTNEKTGAKSVYLDGGPSTNNPSDLAVAEVLKACKKLGEACALKRVNVLSIGTGFPPLGKPGQESGLKTGLPGVLNAFVDIGMNFHSDETDRNTIRRLKKWVSENKNGGVTFSYYRFNPDLQKKVELDGISPAEQKQLHDLGIGLTETSQFQQLVDHLNKGDHDGRYAWKKGQLKNNKNGIYRVGHQLKGEDQASYADDSDGSGSGRNSPIPMGHEEGSQRMRNQDVIDDSDFHTPPSSPKKKKRDRQK